MAQTNLTGKQVLDGSIGRADLNDSIAGSAVIRKIIPGTNITIASTGADAGTGDVTINAAAGTVAIRTVFIDFNGRDFAQANFTVSGALTSQYVIATPSGIMPFGSDDDELEMDPIGCAAKVVSANTVEVRAWSITETAIFGLRAINIILG